LPPRTSSEWLCRIVHKHIKPAEGRDGLFNRAPDSFDVGSVRLDRDSLSAIEFNRFDHGGSRAGVLRVRDGHARSIRGQAFRDRCANAREPPVMSATFLAT